MGCDTSGEKVGSQWYWLRYLLHGTFAEHGIVCFSQLVSIGVHCDELARIHLNVCLGDWGLVAERKVCKIRSEQADRKEVENCFFFFL